MITQPAHSAIDRTIASAMEMLRSASALLIEARAEAESESE